MTEFLTENARRAYPLEREWPAGLDHRWAEALVDACVYASAELGEAHVSLISVGKSVSGSSAKAVFTVGIPDGATLDVEVSAGLGDTATAYAGSAALKAFLTVRGRVVDDILTYGTIAGGDVGIPFALRCSGGAIRRVTGITAQGAGDCRTPMFSTTDAHRVEKSVGSNEHAVIKADDGVDLEVTGMAPLVGDVLRVSALTAPEAAELDEEPVDMMIRGDDCFTVETIPGAKALKDEKGNLVDIVAREEADGDGGVVKIGTACKPCCQCEDYKDAVDMLKPANEEVARLDTVLDGAKAAYDEALAAFAAAKDAARARAAHPDNVKTTATAALSGGLYSAATAAGTRQRIAITLLVENMATANATVTVGADSNPQDGTPTGFVVDGYTHAETAWAKGGNPQLYGNLRPVTQLLKPGETLTVVATYCKSGTSNAAVRPPGMKACCTITVGGNTDNREIDVQ